MKTYASKDTIVEKQDIGYEVMDVDTETRRVKAVWARTGNIDLILRSLQHLLIFK